MARMKGAGEKPGYAEYRSGPADVPVYVVVDGSTGERIWSTQPPKVIRVTHEELDALKDTSGTIGSNGVRQLYDYTERVREVSADDLSATSQRLEGVPVLTADFTEAQLREFQKACEAGYSKARGGYGCERCRDRCARCEALRIGRDNARMASSFMNLARSCGDDAGRASEKDAYAATARWLAAADHLVRTSADFRAEDAAVPEPSRSRVNALIDECATQGSLKSEYDAQFTRAKLRVGAKGSEDEKRVNVLRRGEDAGAAYCPDYGVAARLAELVGLDEKAKYCRACGEEKPRRFEDEEKETSSRGPFARRRALFPNVRELRHGYCVVDLDALDVPWEFEEDPVGEEEKMWEVCEPKNPGTGGERGKKRRAGER